MTKKADKVKKIPAIPPEDYKGSQADWTVGLQERGLWNGEKPEWHGDVMISTDDWWNLLEECEGEEFITLVSDSLKPVWEENEKLWYVHFCLLEEPCSSSFSEEKKALEFYDKLSKFEIETGVLTDEDDEEG